jgi:CheY-like chemotaxis protein
MIEKDIPINVLIVEDDFASFIYLNELLKDDEYKTFHVADGPSAREQLLGNPGKFDLVLLDIQLPGLSGLDIVKEMRASGINTPVIAQTAFAMESDEQDAYDAGCDGYIAKPILKESLMQAISNSFNKTIKH